MWSVSEEPGEPAQPQFNQTPAGACGTCSSKPHLHLIFLSSFDVSNQPEAKFNSLLHLLQQLFGCSSAGQVMEDVRRRKARLTPPLRRQPETSVSAPVCATCTSLAEMLVCSSLRDPAYLRGLRVGHPAAVQEAVDAQGGPTRKRFPAVVADVGFLPRVEDHVLLQVPLQAVALLAVWTGEGPLAAVTHLERRAARVRTAAIREQITALRDDQAQLNMGKKKGAVGEITTALICTSTVCLSGARF